MKLSRRGFTLIEVLLAMLIGGVVLTSIYGVFSSVSGVSQRLESEGEQFHKVRIFFDRIGGELGSLSLERIGDDATLKAGTTTEGLPFIEFNTSLVSPWLERYGGLSRVRYELREGNGERVLFRSEKLLLVDLTEEEAKPFISGVSDFTVRYFNRGSWQDTWTAQSIPQRVEIFFELKTGERSLPFSSSFVLCGVDG